MSHPGGYLAAPLPCIPLCECARSIAIITALLLQTAPAGSVTQSAQPLPKQAYDKNKVWLLLLGGAASLFGVTLLIEGQSGLFPAIARSNQILRMSADERVRLA